MTARLLSPSGVVGMANYRELASDPDTLEQLGNLDDRPSRRADLVM